MARDVAAAASLSSRSPSLRARRYGEADQRGCPA